VTLEHEKWKLAVSGKQSLIRFIPPGDMSKRMSVTLFLRGPVTEGAEGSPEKAASLLFEDPVKTTFVAPLQRHGTAVIDAVPIWSLPARPEADSVFISRSGIWGSLRFADCFPVIVVSEKPFDWCLLVHSGFAGTCRGAVSKGLRKMLSTVGMARAEECHAWIGPGIGGCCYSRSLEDPSTMRAMACLPGDSFRVENGRVYFDLRNAIITQLYDMGIPINNITDTGICTSCSHPLCFSYRKGDRNARSLLLARLYSSYHKQPFWWENV